MTKHKKKRVAVERLAQMVTLKKDDIYTEANNKVKIAKVHNLSSAVARYFAEDDRTVLLVTLTFKEQYRFNIAKMSNKQIIKIASMQHQGINAFLYRLRKESKVKRLRYFMVVELQADGNLHAHLQLSVPQEYLFELVEAIHRIKAKYTKEYSFNGKSAYPIGRTHIGLSARYKKAFQKKYKMSPYKRKALDEDEQSYFETKPTGQRREHYMLNHDRRIVRNGDWTPLEFYTMSLLEELHGAMVEKYLIKTLTGEFTLDQNSIKEGVLKARLKYDTKSLVENKTEQEDDVYINKIHIAFVRKICKKAYTHSRMPFPFKLYQTHRRALIAWNTECKLFYRCIEALRDGELSVHENLIYDIDGNIIKKEV